MGDLYYKKVHEMLEEAEKKYMTRSDILAKIEELGFLP